MVSWSKSTLLTYYHGDVTYLEVSVLWVSCEELFDNLLLTVHIPPLGLQANIS